MHLPIYIDLPIQNGDLPWLRIYIYIYNITYISLSGGSETNGQLQRAAWYQEPVESLRASERIWELGNQTLKS